MTTCGTIFPLPRERARVQSNAIGLGEQEGHVFIGKDGGALPLFSLGLHAMEESGRGRGRPIPAFGRRRK